MKLNALILISLLMAGFACAGLLQKTHPLSTPLPASEVRTAEMVPPFALTDIAGKGHDISDYAGKTVILNFWASWCPPCVAEFPHLVSFAAENPDVVLIALSSDKTLTDIRNFLDRLNPETRTLLNRQNVIIARDHNQTVTSDLFQSISLPETVIIDPGQRLRKKIVGQINSAADLHDALENSSLSPDSR